MTPETSRRLLLAVGHFFLVVVVAVLFNFLLEVSIPRAVPSRLPMTYLLELYVKGIADERSQRVIAAALPWTLALLIRRRSSPSRSGPCSAPTWVAGGTAGGSPAHSCRSSSSPRSRRS